MPAMKDGGRHSDTVHKFYFTDTADSYSVRTFEDSTAMGVIAVAVYREKERPQPLYQSKQATAPPGSSSVSRKSGSGQGGQG